MNNPGAVAVPARLASRPMVGGVVIPWVTVVLADGSPDWRACIRHRVTQCIHERRCQLDGQLIPDTAVFFVADDQMPSDPSEPIVTDVPPVHPECSRYAIQVCPMLNGRQDTYRAQPRRSATSPHNRCAEGGCNCGGYVSVETRDVGGMTVGGWKAVLVADWAMSVAADGAPFAVLKDVRRIRPVQRLEGIRG